MLMVVAIAVASVSMSTSGSAQTRDPTHDIETAQRLYQAVSEHFNVTFVESQVGALRAGGRFAQVVITDSVMFHAGGDVQRERARNVAQYVKNQLRDEPDLRTIRIGWKYAPPGGMSTMLTFDFLASELEPGGPLQRS